MKESFEERPDCIRFENDLDIIEIRPASWELYIKEKDSGEEYYDEFETKDEAKEQMKEEIEDSREEDNDDNDEDENYDYDDYDNEYGDA